MSVRITEYHSNMCPMRVELRLCDITTMKADVCVSSIHRSKDMKMNIISNHLLASAGKSVQDEIYKKQVGRDFAMGQVEVVSAGKLKTCKELAFISLRRYRPGNNEILQQSILECLELAAVKNHKSIAFPALGTGQGYAPESVARCLLEAIAMHNIQYPETSLEIAYIVLLNQNRELIRTFISICQRGTTDLEDEKNTLSAEDRESVFASGLSFGGGHTNVYGDDSFQGTAKPRMTGKTQMPKASEPKKKMKSQQTTNNIFSQFFSSAVSLLTRKGVSGQYGPLIINVRPQATPSIFGFQLNVGIDVSIIDNFVPAPLRTFFENLGH